MKSKRGWIRIIEATFAILLVAGVLLTLVTKGYIGKEDISSKVSDIQISVLREIEINGDLRELVVGYTSGPIPLRIVEKINTRMPDYLFCESKICSLNEICSIDDFPTDQDIYSEAVAITTNSIEYSPKQLRMFCRII